MTTTTDHPARRRLAELDAEAEAAHAAWGAVLNGLNDAARARWTRLQMERAAAETRLERAVRGPRQTGVPDVEYEVELAELRTAWEAVQAKIARTRRSGSPLAPVLEAEEVYFAAMRHIGQERMRQEILLQELEDFAL
jgi:hypothetical protein